MNRTGLPHLPAHLRDLQKLSETSTKLRKKKKNKLRKKQYKLAEESDSDSDWLPEEAVAASLSEESGTEKSSSEESGTEEGGEEAFDAREFQRFVQKIFPSKSVPMGNLLSFPIASISGIVSVIK